MSNWQRGQIITINKENYIVDNMIEFCEDSWIWQEYEIRKLNTEYNSNVQKLWLTVEQDKYNTTQYYLYSKCTKNININDKEFEDNGKKYELFETGEATVKSIMGPTDVDINEKCKYYDYISENKREIISVEIWSDEIEYTLGTKIESYQIEIKDEINNEYLKKSTKNSSGYVFGISLFFIIILIFSFIGSIASSSNNSIEKYMSKNSNKYTYITSVTNNSNNKKAKVYMSKAKTLDEVVKDLIDGVPEGITEAIDHDITTEKDGYALETKKEYAYIYMHDDEKIYVQVSNKEYVNNSGTAYHSSHNSYYHNSYINKDRSSVYYDYASSARQESINSRSSSGGGTSSGK